MYEITVLAGDGIGNEITQPAVEVLKAAADKFGFEVNLTNALIGGAAIDAAGNPLPDETLAQCRKSDGIILGAVGGPKWEKLPDGRPEQGLLRIREELGLYANLRPAIVYEALRDASPLKPEVLGEKLDILVVRELTGGIYFGKRGTETKDGQPYAYDTEEYSKSEIIRIGKIAFESAMKRSKRVCSVDKANVLDSSRLWRKTIIELSADYPEIELSHMYVDNAAMQLVRDPNQFDVIVTNNIFGDILSDEASQITGSIGMLPSASIGKSGLGIYEPIHGSAPDIAGKNLANPIATILSVAMMLRYSLGEPEAATAIEAAVEAVINDGVRTADLAPKGESFIGTKEVGQLILNKIIM